jgi:hypothetical protein
MFCRASVSSPQLCCISAFAPQLCYVPAFCYGYLNVVFP